MTPQPAGLLHPLAQDVGDFHQRFIRPLADEADVLHARRLQEIEDFHELPTVTPRSPRRYTSFLAAVSIF